MLDLIDFCELLDASMERLLAWGGPTAHLFATPAPGMIMAAQAGVSKEEAERAAENKELRFHPAIDPNSDAIARTMGRGAGKVCVHVVVIVLLSILRMPACGGVCKR